MSQELVNAIADMREDEALRITNDLLDRGTNPLDILEASRKAMEIVSERFEAGDCFVPELILAGEMLKGISERVKPYLAEEAQTKKIGRVVIGTVEGDIHDIGKDIVTFMLDINGFDVRDLGVDVPPAKFVEAVADFQPQVVGLSGFLTLAYDPMKATVDALKNSGYTNIKIMIGGGQIDEQVRAYTGANGFGRDAMAAVVLAKQWIGGE